MEILSESSSFSPRISFSCYLTLYDVVPVEQPHFLSGSSGVDSGFEFDLSSCESFKHELCAADELFSEGKITPREIQEKNPFSDSTQNGSGRGGGGGGGGAEEQGRHATPLQSPVGKKKSMKQLVKQGGETEEKPGSISKSIWRFKRSSSLDCGSGYGRKLCPLPLLSRSNSAGPAEVQLARESQSYHHHQKQHQQTYSQKHPPPSPPLQSKPLQDQLSNGFHQRQRPPSRRGRVFSSSHGSSSTTIVNPALNIHSGNLFGFGSIIFSGKDRNKKK